MRGADHWTALIISGIKWGMSTLYIVATPIGNLEDITARALRILGEVNFIACEDTRVTGRLLNRYSIKKSLIAYHARNAKKAGSELISRLKMGESCALVTDAGTPGISDLGRIVAHQTRLRCFHCAIQSLPLRHFFLSRAFIFQFFQFSPHKGQTLVQKSEYLAWLSLQIKPPHRKSTKELAEMEKGRL